MGNNEDYKKKVFDKLRILINYTYRNPQLDSVEINEMLEGLLRDGKKKTDEKKEPSIIYKNYKSKYLNGVFREVYDAKNTLQSNPNKSIVFNWDRVVENPFFLLWKHAEPSESFRLGMTVLLNNYADDSYLIKKGMFNQSVLDIPSYIVSVLGKDEEKGYEFDCEILGKLGLLTVLKKTGQITFLKLNQKDPELDLTILERNKNFIEFTRRGPCSVIGSYIADRFFPDSKSISVSEKDSKFLISAIDSDILYKVFISIQNRNAIHLKLPYGWKLVFPLCVCQDMRTGDISLIFLSATGLSSCCVHQVYSAEVEEKHFDYDIAARGLKDYIDKRWKILDFDIDRNDDCFDIEIDEIDDFEEVSRLFDKFHVEKKSTKMKISGTTYNVMHLFPYLLHYIGRIIRFNVKGKSINLNRNEEIKRFFGNLLYKLCFTYNLPSIKFLGTAYSSFDKYEMLALHEPIYDYNFFVSSKDIPAGYTEESFDETDTIFSPFYNRYIISEIMKKNVSLITIPELRWLYSVIDYESAENDGFEYLRDYFKKSGIRKLFTPETFIRIRSAFKEHSYFVEEGECKCLLEFPSGANGIFDLFPQTRNNLSFNSKKEICETYFNYKSEDEDLVLSMVLEAGTEFKITSPESMIMKIKKRIMKQVEYFMKDQLGKKPVDVYIDR